MASPNGGEDFESSLLSFEKLDRASPDLWPERLPGVSEFAASFKNPITYSPPKWMAELESEDIEMLKELGSLTTANLMEKVKGLQNLAYQLGLDECFSKLSCYLKLIVLPKAGSTLADSKQLILAKGVTHADCFAEISLSSVRAREMTRGKFLNILERPKK
ncbi:protein lin-52 homolog isoform X1 [Myxocyprinus asiaticus]|uniref:protein lin-52 homolog isoform X1 n=1 Tax=Myxocyprinus asiaticus TaxID=70543 RepID=UPI0022230AB8|nr:protein lin-52 homolog isoform X1 [Myxocyprinus asiaticus]